MKAKKEGRTKRNEGLKGRKAKKEGRTKRKEGLKEMKG
jgi:hypothetical protein